MEIFPTILLIYTVGQVLTEKDGFFAFTARAQVQRIQNPVVSCHLFFFFSLNMTKNSTML